ncbi:MAG: hypothetical protein LQ349_006668 [Xanthoria aureola]|nr:MAG: hypothetical protein LQ349_006668 [Xanthoria aureola]
MQLFSFLFAVLSLTTFALALVLPPPTVPVNPLDISVAPPSAINTLSTRAPHPNCDGSFYCTIYTGNFIQRAYRLATTGLQTHRNLDPTIWNLGPMNDTAFYATGHHALCLPNNPMMRTGFCVFAQYSGSERGGMTGREVKAMLKVLSERECNMCGSVPDLKEGGGWLTANYVDMGACGGICKEVRFN